MTATTAGVTGRAELTIEVPLPTTVAVTPETVALTALGHTARHWEAEEIAAISDNLLLPARRGLGVP